VRRVIPKPYTTDSCNPIPLTLNTELVEMGVGPPHGNLEDVVQIGDGALTAVPITGEICLATATESPPAP
jgi:hypothetical protein